MKLIVDSRERELIKKTKEYIVNSELSINLDVEQMDLGDAKIVDASNNVIAIFERKSLDDLCSSIMDGRYKEQSFRLNQYNLHNHNVYYIIEGIIEKFVPKKITRISRKAMYSAIVSLNYHKGFSVMRTTSIVDTSRTLIQFLEKIKNENKPCYYDNNDTEAQYSSVIKTAKKSQITTENIHEIMLMQIPGVSSMAARTIMNNFSGIVDLIASLQENIKILDDIKITGKNGKDRKISKTAIDNIKLYLLS
tara:strand:+ start:1034 stop:1783 length:750 start_codon:yes stop_codon:yes gene_type:complete